MINHNLKIKGLFNKSVAAVFLLGFSSGLPYLLIVSTMLIWLTENGVSKLELGLFAWITIPYSFKFVISFVLKKIKIPLLQNLLGFYRSLILVLQISLILLIFSLSQLDPAVNLSMMVLVSLLIALASASQDILIEYSRLRILPEKYIGYASTINALGYRCGLLCSGAGAIYLSAFTQSWQISYQCMALMMCFGILGTLLANNFHDEAPNKSVKPRSSISFEVRQLLDKRHPLWLLILLIFSFRLPDVLMHYMSAPFMLEINFTKLEIAHASKSLGIVAMMLGIFSSGFVINKISMQKSFLISIVLLVISSILFCYQSYVGNIFSVLCTTMFIENFASGFSRVVLISYFSKICMESKSFIQLAILTSFSSFVKVIICSFSGWLASMMSWNHFFLFVALSCIPCFVIITLNKQRLNFYSIQSDIPKGSIGITKGLQSC